MSTLIHMSKSDRNKVLKLAREAGMIRVRDLRERGIHHEHLRRLVSAGQLVRLGRGIYGPTDNEPSQNHSLAQVSKQIPQAVICLLSALRFHETGTQNPFDVWIAIDRRTRKPSISHPSLRVVRFSGPSLTEGIEQHEVERIPVKVYCLAKTIADCFKYRNKIGTDVAIEALREGIRNRSVTADDIWQYAKICRVSSVIRPYLEAMV